MKIKEMRIVFMGTPEFAVPSIELLLNRNYYIAAVITSPDKPSGRGLKIQQSAVKKFALKNNLKVLQPVNLKDREFIRQLLNIKPDLQIVVAFRMLPDEVWQLPRFGTFNLHASLLPNYRGAAPINWAIINGEKKTGVTTFFIEHDIDTGKIIFQEEVPIDKNDTAGDLHNKLKIEGAKLVCKTVDAIVKNSYKLTNQVELFTKEQDLKKAPKIHKEDCKISWYNGTVEIFNFIRGLSPYPGAWTEIISDNKSKIVLKIYKAEYEEESHNLIPGVLLTNQKTFLRVTTQNGFIKILELQQEGKKRLKIEEFLRGFQQLVNYKFQ
jgi:methionyl-tRNA formyltransferase